MHEEKTFKKTFLSGYRRKKSIEEAMHDENYHITKNSPILTIKCIVQGKNKNIKKKKTIMCMAKVESGRLSRKHWTCGRQTH
jgi:hypothetical protein